ncbi:MAG: efflux RND transporter periplasmic adaptor subunit [Verrucomicrobiae bacterium]|nr:efflux RND transporter periplasmic adaptor subunit [Verrucomicrobiae bacterium]
MKSINLYSIFNTRICLVFGIAAGLIMLGGCGQKETEVATLEQEEAFANIPHSHETAGETCFICDPAKREKGRLWCTEHARYEDRCWICHPELEDKDRLWCKEHSLYEDECFLCHPELGAADSTRQSDADTKVAQLPQNPSLALFCNEHQVAEVECGICQPDLVASLPPGGDMKVRFPSLASAEKVGLRTDFPVMTEAAPTIKAFCETQYNLNAMAKISPLVGGVIRDVIRDLGDKVRMGNVLLELHSAEVATAKSNYLAALVNLDIHRQTFERESRLSQQNIAAQKDLLAASADYRTARFTVSNLRQKLVNFGLNEEEISTIEKEQDTSASLLIRAPFDGTLVDRNAVRGETVETGEPLFTIADLSTNWLILSIPSDHIGQVSVGQIVEARFSELPGTTIHGRITWLDTSIDPRSRMVRARAVVTDDAHLIKSGMFGDAQITVGDIRPAAFVPMTSVQRHDGNDFVFVRNETDLFSLRRVALGNSDADKVEVLLGLNPTDSVVTEGSFIVMSEFLKSRLGAGCVDD